MRISDWSSDVCSSDLTSWVDRAAYDEQAKALTERIANKPAIEFYDIAKDPDELENLAAEPKYQALVQSYLAKLQAWMEAQGDKGAAQIGRSSCRERVCHYGEHSVGALPMKKKKHK